MTRRTPSWVTYAVVLAEFAFFIGYLVPRVANIAGYNGYADGILQAHAFLSAMRERFPDEILLVTSERVEGVTLNRLSEIALTPVGGVAGYVFPYLTALNGSDFRVVPRAEFCAMDLPPRGLAILPPALVGPPAPPEASGDLLRFSLASGYGLVMHRNAFVPFVAEFHEVIGGLAFNEHSEPYLRPADEGVQVVPRPWGDQTQYLLVSKSPTMRLTPPDGIEKIGELVFGMHPLHAWPFERIRLQYANPAREVVLTPADFSIANPSITLHDLEAADVTMGEAAFSPPFGGYVFVMHNPKVRLLRTLPDGRGAAAFQLCGSPVAVPATGGERNAR